MGRGSGSGPGRASSGPRLGTRFVGTKELASVPIEGAGVQRNRVDRQKDLIRKGLVNQNTVKLTVQPDGTVSVDDGRHRILAAREIEAETGRPVKLRVQFRRGRRVRR